MIHENSHPHEIVNFAEELMVSSRLKRSGHDKAVMATLFNVLAPVQWLQGEEWKEYALRAQVKIAWLAGNQMKRGGFILYFTRYFHAMWRDTLKGMKQEDVMLFCESLKAFYYFHCPVGQNAVSR